MRAVVAALSLAIIVASGFAWASYKNFTSNVAHGPPVPGRTGSDPDRVSWKGSVGLWIGGEGPGLAADLVEQCDERVTIPMAPQVESLNAAVAGALLVYAARRQRT